MVKYSLHSEKTGKNVPMSNRWLRDFKQIMWNEGQKVIFDNGDTTTTIETFPGRYQGQRVWRYFVHHLRYGEVDYGRVVEN